MNNHGNVHNAEFNIVDMSLQYKLIIRQTNLNTLSDQCCEYQFVLPNHITILTMNTHDVEIESALVAKLGLIILHLYVSVYRNRISYSTEDSSM